MKKKISTYTLIGSLFLFITACSENVQKCSNIEIKNAFSRATSGPTGALFMDITNTSSFPIFLVGVEPNSFTIADQIELHDHLEEESVLKMRSVEGIQIPPHSTVGLKSGGKHVMFFGLKEPLQEKSKKSLTLKFKQVADQKSFSCPIVLKY